MILLKDFFTYEVLIEDVKAVKDPETKDVSYVKYDRVEQRTIQSVNGLISYIIKKEKVFQNFDITREDYVRICHYVEKTFQHEQRPLDELDITDDVYAEIIETILDYIVWG